MREYNLRLEGNKAVDANRRAAEDAKENAKAAEQETAERKKREANVKRYYERLNSKEGQQFPDEIEKPAGADDFEYDSLNKTLIPKTRAKGRETASAVADAAMETLTEITATVAVMRNFNKGLRTIRDRELFDGTMIG